MGTSFNKLPKVKENFIKPPAQPGPAAEPIIYPSVAGTENAATNAVDYFTDQETPNQNVVKPSQVGTGGDSLQERVQQIRNDENTKEKEYSVGYYDIDESLGYYIENIIRPTVVENNELIKVPTFYGSPERWAATQNFGYYRDNKSKLILPLIMYRRISVSRNENILFPRISQLYYTAARKWDSKTKYDNFYARNMKGKYNTDKYSIVSLPNYVNITYEGIIWTSFVEQMNKIVEKFQFADNSYWGDPKKFKFRAQIDSFDTATELTTDTERMVRATFNITIYGYILTEAFNNILTTKTMLGIKRVVFTESSEIDISIPVLPEAVYDPQVVTYNLDFDLEETQDIDFMNQ